MSNESRFDTITPDELMVWMDGKKPFYLIHILTNNHFQKVHLPGAWNACVFEVNFLKQMNSISAAKNTEIVLYGSSGRSRDALAAAEKLQADGYQQEFNRKHEPEG